jgi:excisionase family DNA binding protein
MKSVERFLHVHAYVCRRMSTDRPDRLLTVSEAARVLGVSSSTMHRWISDGRVTAMRLGDEPGAPVRILASDLAELIHIYRPKVTQ